MCISKRDEVRGVLERRTSKARTRTSRDHYYVRNQIDHGLLVPFISSSLHVLYMKQAAVSGSDRNLVKSTRAILAANTALHIRDDGTFDRPWQDCSEHFFFGSSGDLKARMSMESPGLSLGSPEFEVY